MNIFINITKLLLLNTIIIYDKLKKIERIKMKESNLT